MMWSRPIYIRDIRDIRVMDTLGADACHTFGQVSKDKRLEEKCHFIYIT